MDRRAFMKLGGLVAASAGILTGSIPVLSRAPREPAFNQPNPAEFDNIPHIVNVLEPLNHGELEFQVDRLNIFPPDWLQIYKSEYFPYYITAERQEMSDKDKITEGYSRLNLPHRTEIPPGVLNTPALDVIDPETIPELKAIKNIQEPRTRFEAVLKAVSPATYADFFPRDAIQSGFSGIRAKMLWDRLENVSTVHRAMGVYLDALKDFVKNNPNHSRMEEVIAEMERHQTVKDEFEDHYEKPIMIELGALTSNTHWMVNSQVWPDSHVTPNTASTYCYGFVGTVIDIMSWMNDEQEMSPVVRSPSGLYKMRDSSGLESNRFNINNFFTDFKIHSEARGWTDVTHLNFNEILELTGRGGHYLVGLDYNYNRIPAFRRGTHRTRESEREPYHSFILHDTVEFPDKLFLAELYGSPPNGSLYKLVDNDDFTFSYIQEGVKLYAHKF